jgi:hypothetical protein
MLISFASNGAKITSPSFGGIIPTPELKIKVKLIL